MSKTNAGICVVGGLIGALVSISIAGKIGSMPGRPDTDLLLQLGQFAFAGLGIGCIALFAYGAMNFSKS